MHAATATVRDVGELLREGERLEPLTFPVISRATLALFAGASGDHNAIHIDTDAAHAAGLDDVIAHGMLSMAYLSRYVLQWTAQDALRSLDVRFAAVTPVLATPICSGRVARIEHRAGRRLAHLELAVHLSDGTLTVTGAALVAIDETNASLASHLGDLGADDA